LEILKDWRPATQIYQILLQIKEVLRAPNPDNAANADVGKEMNESAIKFTKTAKEWTAKYAKSQ